jgi:hypothetical protein
MAIINLWGYSLRENSTKKLGKVYSRGSESQRTMIHNTFTIIWELWIKGTGIREDKN